jgi:RNA polymerase sigma-70 factor (ECF subfamily)
MALGYGYSAAVPTTKSDQKESDEQLVARIVEGDQAAFEQVYERFFRRVYNFVDRRMSNSADTEETVQEVFISVFNSLESFRAEAPFAAWVFGLTRRTIAGRFKRKRHPMVPLVDEDDDAQAARSLAPSPIEAYECNEMLTHMEEKLDRRLSPEQRELFQLHHLEDRPISEIAEQLEKSEDSIKSNLYRARKILLAR